MYISHFYAILFTNKNPFCVSSGMDKERTMLCMAKAIITIGRQYGSGGREIGQRLAEKLGIKCYDSELLDRAAKTAVCARRF